MLALARALCLEPKPLLMDEPSEGLMPAMIAAILEAVRLLKARGVAIVLVEKKVAGAFVAADRIALIENSRTAATATPAALAEDPSPPERTWGGRTLRHGYA